MKIPNLHNLFKTANTSGYKKTTDFRDGNYYYSFNDSIEGSEIDVYKINTGISTILNVLVYKNSQSIKTSNTITSGNETSTLSFTNSDVCRFVLNWDLPWLDSYILTPEERFELEFKLSTNELILFDALVEYSVYNLDFRININTNYDAPEQLDKLFQENV